MMRVINIILIIFLFGFSLSLGRAFYRVDKLDFVCPINYGNSPIQIRVDLAGDGNFRAGRNGRRRHKGVDILADIDEPIYAPLGGIVINAEHERGYGNYIEIKHTRDNIKTIYAHLSKIAVSKNQFVRQGQLIGFVGKTGNARGKKVLPHLHFEMYKDEKLINPASYLE